MRTSLDREKTTQSNVSVGPVRVALIQRMMNRDEYNLEELSDLCRTAGYLPTFTLTQVRPPHPRYHFGPGKLRELQEAVKRLGVQKVLSENELKPVQEYNLAKLLNLPVATRTQLILEIFTKHAASNEAKLQIRLAELKYELSRAKEKVRLAKRGEQPGFHGLGAYEADVYYNEVSRRILKINEKLADMRNRRNLSRTRRAEDGIPSVSLTGYTNAGKSTIFNLLASESVPVDQQLFTTLSTTVRMVRVAGKRAYLSDTVGFIKKLPPLLVDAFNSTLSEIVYSDLILLVVDLSDPLRMIADKIDSSLTILNEIGVTNAPILLVFNKIDRLVEDVNEKIAKLGVELPYVAISALRQTNVEELRARIASMMGGYVRATATLAENRDTYRLLDEVRESGNIARMVFDNGHVQVEFEAPVRIAERVRKVAEMFEVVGPDAS